MSMSPESESKITNAKLAASVVDQRDPALDGAGLPIRVVRIIDRLNVGGPAKHVTWLTAGLANDGYETTLVTGKVAAGEGDMSYFARDAGISPIVIKRLSRELQLADVFVIARLVNIFRETKPQIIHTHKAKAGAVGRVAAFIYKWLTPSALVLRPRRCKVIHTYHGHVFHSYFGRAKTRLFVGIERLLARFCTDQIITVSEQQRREIHEEFGVGRLEQFRVVPLGIDLQEIRPVPGELRRELGIADGEFVIGAVGRLCEVKNYQMLLRAAAQLIKAADTMQSIRLVLVGDGHLRGELETLARELGIAHRVSFAGLRQNVNAIYCDFDVVALTSLNEGTPLTLIEAMMCGRAVVATEVGGVVDLMGTRQSAAGGFSIWDHGVTCPSGDVEGFARGLRHLQERPEQRRVMGEESSRRAKQNHSKDRLIADIAQCYRELAGITGSVPLQSGHASLSYGMPLSAKKTEPSSTN